MNSLSNQQEPIYQTNYLGFYIKVFPDHVEFKSAKGERSIPMIQVAGAKAGAPLTLQIFLMTTDDQEYRIPTRAKQEASEAILQARANFLAAQPSIPIDEAINQVKLAIQQLGLQIRQVNANMATVRAHYQQSHMHGGGKVGGFIRDGQRTGKDANLKKQQPVKEQLQQRKLTLEQRLNELKILKAQGTTYIRP